MLKKEVNLYKKVSERIKKDAVRVRLELNHKSSKKSKILS